MTLSLDAREVLRHLNEMGYRNIATEQLKEFMKDLKKLIKYEERLGTLYDYNKNMLEIQKPTTSTKSHAEYLHETISKAKFTVDTASKERQDDQRRITKKNKESGCEDQRYQIKKKDSSADNQSSRKRGSIKKTESLRKAKIRVNAPLKTESIKTLNTDRTDKTTETRTKMWIRPRSRTPSSRNQRPNDPVVLYQYYQKEWQRLKPFLPGENSHADLRWQIRHKLLGDAANV